jgi:glycosyltransferase 2 family protein
MKRRITVGIFLSVLFIYLSFWKPDFSGLWQGKVGFFAALFGQSRINLEQLGEALAQVRYLYLLGGVLLLILSLFSRAQRWVILLRPVHPGIRYWSVYAAMNTGYMINNILPLRMGEIFRAYFLGRAEGISKSSALATIVVERLIDTLAALILLSITLFFFPFPDWIRNGLFYIGAAVMLLILFLVGLLVNTEWTLGVMAKLMKPLPQRWSRIILKTIHSFSGGLEILRSSHHYLAILGHTILLQSCYIISVFLTLLAFDLVSPVYPAISGNPLLASVVMLVIVTIGVGLPSAPGAVGTFHGIVAFGVALFGVPNATAMSFAIMLHLSNYVPLTMLGLGCFWSQNFSFSDIKTQLPHEDLDVPGSPGDKDENSQQRA